MLKRLLFIASFLAVMATLLTGPAAAQQVVTIIEEEWVDGEWVVVDTLVDRREEAPAARAVNARPSLAATNSSAAFGPFRVIDSETAAIVDITDRASPRHFAAMLAAHPDIAVLNFVDAPGTHDDIANFRIGRMLREHGIATRVPADGSVRSGAVELFLSGVTTSVHPDSEFAVHGWLDDRGLGAEDYPMGSPEHRRYLDYYVEMGMDYGVARAFYAMTNSVPFENALWLTGRDMQGWLDLNDDTDRLAESAEHAPEWEMAAFAYPRLAYLDFDLSFQ